MVPTMGDSGTGNKIPAAATSEHADSTVISSGSAVPGNPLVESPAQLRMTRLELNFQNHHRRLLQGVTAVILAILAIEWIYLTTQRPEPLPIQRGQYFQTQFQVEINSATWVEWLQLDGIGPSLAHRIVADRKLNGPFESIDDINRVPGIGPATLDRIRRCLTIRHDLSDTTTSGSSDTRHSSRQ